VISDRHDEGFAIWLTGLSGAGKSTLASALERELRARNHRVEVLDGDELRSNVSQDLGFSKADRDMQVQRIAYLSHLLVRNGVGVIVAAVSPYAEARARARERIGRFVEVHVHCNLDELVKRDVKGLYRRALAGEIENFTGVSDPYEPPVAPEVRVDSAAQTPEESLAAILSCLEERDYLDPSPLPVEGAIEP
jgi:adenylyl-sulfate kinase